MALAEVEAFADVRAKVQDLVANAGGALWDAAPSYDRADVPAFLDQLIPLLVSGQRQAVALTDAFIARRMGRRPVGVDPQAVINGIRGDVDPEEVYSRPFRELWWGVSQGKLWKVSERAARARLLAALRTDVLLATTHTMVAVAEQDGQIAGYSRVVRGTCDLCEEAKGEVTGGVILQPIHPGCECVGDPRKSVAATRKNATVGTRVHTVVGSKEKVGPTGVITKTREMTSGQGFDVKVKFDPIPGHPIRAVREGTNEKWISNPGLNLKVIEEKAPSGEALASEVKIQDEVRGAARGIMDQVKHWRKDAKPEDLAAGEKRWAKNLKGYISADAKARQAVEAGVELNKTSPGFQRLIDKWGGGKDVLVIVDAEKVPADSLLHFSDFAAGQRLGHTTFISDIGIAESSIATEGVRPGVAGMIRHEFGHSLYDVMGRDLQLSFREQLSRLPKTEIANRTDRLEYTDYIAAWSREDEAFCEAVRVVYDPAFDPSRYSSEFQDLANWMKENL